MVRIGQACETQWRIASNLAKDARFAALPHEIEIRQLEESTSAIPVPERKTWRASPEYEDYTGEIEALLHKRAGSDVIGGFEVEDETFGGEYEGGAPRFVSVSTKPKRGTRKHIIAKISQQFGLPESRVDNLWQEYRRLERKLAEARDSAKT